MTIENKVVVIAGASSGIGAATAKLLASKGAKLVLGARREERLAEIASEIGGDNVIYQATDVTDKDQVKALIDLAVEKFGRLDVLYNNAGIMPREKLADAKFENWEKEININIMGVLHGIAAALPIVNLDNDLMEYYLL